jgi:hypothetical protein
VGIAISQQREMTPTSTKTVFYVTQFLSLPMSPPRRRPRRREGRARTSESLSAHDDEHAAWRIVKSHCPIHAFKATGDCASREFSPGESVESRRISCTLTGAYPKTQLNKRGRSRGNFVFLPNTVRVRRTGPVPAST